MPSSLAFSDILPFPLLSRHRPSADLLALLYLHAVVEHAEVAPDRDQRRVLVVKLHAQRSVHRLRDFGNRGGRLVADLVGVDDRHPRHQDHHGLAVLALLGPGDELVAPAHDLADVRKAAAPSSTRSISKFTQSPTIVLSLLHHSPSPQF